MRRLRLRHVVSAAALAAALALLPAAAAPAASTVEGNYSFLGVEGDGADNRISIVREPGGGSVESTFLVRDTTGVTIVGDGCEPTADPTAVRCPALEDPGCTAIPRRTGPTRSPTCTFQAVHVDGGEGDDEIRIGYPHGPWDPDQYTEVDAGPGADVVGGSSARDTVLAGTGDDRLDGGAGPDGLDPGTGNDVVYGGPDADRISDGDDPAAPDADVFDGDSCGEAWCKPALSGQATGPDRLDYLSRTAAMTVDLTDDGPAQGEAGEGDVIRGFESVSTGSGDDDLQGSAAAGALAAGAGADTVHGGAGDDELDGGPGEDVITGGTGDDEIHPGDAYEDGYGNVPDGRDVVDAGDGFDMVLYQRSAGVVVDLARTEDQGGQGENDSLTGFEGAEANNSLLYGNDGPNRLVGDGVFEGRGGDDRLTGLFGNQTLRGGPGDDVLDGGPGLDVLEGGDGADVLRGGSTPVSDGAFTTSTTTAGDGADRMDGGPGTDTVDYSDLEVGVRVDLHDGDGNGSIGEKGPLDNDTVIDVENARGGTRDDDLVGNDEVNFLSGMGGSDSLETRDATADAADCGAGSDVAFVDTLDATTACEGIVTDPPTSGTTTTGTGSSTGTASSGASVGGASTGEAGTGTGPAPEPQITGPGRRERLAPRRVTQRSRCRSATARTARCTTEGRVVLPARLGGPGASSACLGRVRVELWAGQRRLSLRRVRLRSSCRYRSRALVRVGRSRTRALTVRVHFQGSFRLFPRTAPAGRVRIAR